MQTYHLRPHHGLCLHYFRGHGYSQEFVDNMQEILDTLEKNPNVQLVDYADDICLTCPNSINTIHNLSETDAFNRFDKTNLTVEINHLHKTYCVFHKKVLHYDSRVMELCDLTYNSILPWNEFNKLIHNNILTQNLRETICGDCEWSHLCHK